MSLRGFVLRRIGTSLIAVFGVSLLVFLFLHIVPGDPVDQLAGGEATPEQRQAVIQCMNLDKSMPAQFGLFWKNVFNGSLGRQCPDAPGKPPVRHLIVEVFPYTAELAVAGLLLAILFALPLGIFAAVKRGTLYDTAATIVSLSGISIPVIWMGPLFIFIFYLKLAWLPGPAEADEPFALLLPAIVIATHLMAMLSRMTRSSLLDVLGEDYMRTARAKGLSNTSVVLKHGLRNAILPVITVAGIQFGAMLAGAIITESVFERPGLGTLLFDAISQRNYPVVQGCVFVIAIGYVLVNLFIDLAYGLADPRIRHR